MNARTLHPSSVSLLPSSDDTSTPPFAKARTTAPKKWSLQETRYGSIENSNYPLPATLTLRADPDLAEDVEPLTVTLRSAAPAHDRIVTLTGGRNDLAGTPVRGSTARRSAGAVGFGPQTDRATANCRVGTADPLRYSP